MAEEKKDGDKGDKPFYLEDFFNKAVDKYAPDEMKGFHKQTLGLMKTSDKVTAKMVKYLWDTLPAAAAIAALIALVVATPVSTSIPVIGVIATSAGMLDAYNTARLRSKEYKTKVGAVTEKLIDTSPESLTTMHRLFVRSMSLNPENLTDLTAVTAYTPAQLQNNVTLKSALHTLFKNTIDNPANLKKVDDFVTYAMKKVDKGKLRDYVQKSKGEIEKAKQEFNELVERGKNDRNFREGGQINARIRQWERRLKAAATEEDRIEIQRQIDELYDKADELMGFKQNRTGTNGSERITKEVKFKDKAEIEQRIKQIEDDIYSIELIGDNLTEEQLLAIESLIAEMDELQELLLEMDDTEANGDRNTRLTKAFNTSNFTGLSEAELDLARTNLNTKLEQLEEKLLPVAQAGGDTAAMDAEIKKYQTALTKLEAEATARQKGVENVNQYMSGDNFDLNDETRFNFTESGFLALTALLERLQNQAATMDEDLYKKEWTKAVKQVTEADKTAKSIGEAKITSLIEEIIQDRDRMSNLANKLQDQIRNRFAYSYLSKLVNTPGNIKYSKITPENLQRLTNLINNEATEDTFAYLNDLYYDEEFQGDFNTPQHEAALEAIREILEIITPEQDFSEDRLLDAMKKIFEGAHPDGGADKLTQTFKKIHEGATYNLRNRVRAEAQKLDTNVREEIQTEYQAATNKDEKKGAADKLKALLGTVLGSIDEAILVHVIGEVIENILERNDNPPPADTTGEQEDDAEESKEKLKKTVSDLVQETGNDNIAAILNENTIDNGLVDSVFANLQSLGLDERGQAAIFIAAYITSDRGRSIEFDNAVNRWRTGDKYAIPSDDLRDKLYRILRDPDTKLGIVSTQARTMIMDVWDELKPEIKGVFYQIYKEMETPIQSQSADVDQDIDTPDADPPAPDVPDVDETPTKLAELGREATDLDNAIMMPMTAALDRIDNTTLRVAIATDIVKNLNIIKTFTENDTYNYWSELATALNNSPLPKGSVGEALLFSLSTPEILTDGVFDIIKFQNTLRNMQPDEVSAAAPTKQDLLNLIEEIEPGMRMTFIGIIDVLSQNGVKLIYAVLNKLRGPQQSDTGDAPQQPVAGADAPPPPPVNEPSEPEESTPEEIRSQQIATIAKRMRKAELYSKVWEDLEKRLQNENSEVLANMVQNLISIEDSVLENVVVKMDPESSESTGMTAEENAQILFVFLNMPPTPANP